MITATAVGRLTDTPNLRYLDDGTPVANFSPATDNRNRDETTFLRVAIWGKASEAAALRGRGSTTSFERPPIQHLRRTSRIVQHSPDIGSDVSAGHPATGDPSVAAKHYTGNIAEAERVPGGSDTGRWR
ncbi:MAG: single-stranded DNA-binding protein [Acidimicrobiia bacterium]|nr:single-stranded DNA-binding protein [Acidimicrobiia bacterium]